MKNEITQEEIKKFWEWCGFEPISHLGQIVSWRYPNKDRRAYLPQITPNSLFKYAVPKLLKDDKYPQLTEIILDPLEGWTVYLRYRSLHDDGCVEREEVSITHSTPAIALFRAIQEVIKL
jgi:hypothetical protein